MILFAIWLLGLVSSYTMGGYLHSFLAAGVAVVAPRIIWGRKTATS
jgi:hypothetical protein